MHLKKETVRLFLFLGYILNHKQNFQIISTNTPYTLAKLENDNQWQYDEKENMKYQWKPVASLTDELQSLCFTLQHQAVLARKANSMHY